MTVQSWEKDHGHKRVIRLMRRTLRVLPSHREFDMASFFDGQGKRLANEVLSGPRISMGADDAVFDAAGDFWHEAPMDIMVFA